MAIEEIFENFENIVITVVFVLKEKKRRICQVFTGTYPVSFFPGCTKKCMGEKGEKGKEN